MTSYYCIIQLRVNLISVPRYSQKLSYYAPTWVSIPQGPRMKYTAGLGDSCFLWGPDDTAPGGDLGQSIHKLNSTRDLNTNPK